MKKIMVIYTVFIALVFSSSCAHPYYKEQGWDKDGKVTTIHNTNNIFN